MQPASAPASHRLHWIPIAPSWIVSGGLILLAAMSHKIPAKGRAFIYNPIGAVLAFAGAAWLFTKHPVLGIATLLLIASVLLHRRVEAFASPPIFIKDRIKKSSHHWLQEDIMSEEPTLIQDRTEDNTFLSDKVSPEERSAHWYDEEALGEYPTGIQEKGVTEPDRNPDY